MKISLVNMIWIGNNKYNQIIKPKDSLKHQVNQIFLKLILWEIINII